MVLHPTQARHSTTASKAWLCYIKRPNGKYPQMGLNLRRSRRYLDIRQYGIILGDCTLVAILFFMDPLYG